MLNEHETYSLDGLGLINDHKEITVLESPGSYYEKTDIDKDKIATMDEKFSTDEEFCEYLKNWLGSTGVLIIEPVDEETKQYVNFSSIFHARFNNQNVNTNRNNLFCIFAVHNSENVRCIIEQLVKANVSVNNVNKVIIGYFTVSKELKEYAGRIGVELVGRDEIYEINNAIDLGKHKMPYVTLSQNKFYTELSSELNKYYSSQQTQSFMSLETGAVGGNLSSIGHNLSSSMQEGIDQFKNSFNAAINDCKNMFSSGNNNQN
jgi:hypothetical protein